MNIHGIKLSRWVVADADGLIAIFSEEDVHHTKAKKALSVLLAEECELIISVATVAELTTTLHTKLKQPEIIPRIVTQIKSGKITVVSADEGLLEQAFTFFDPEQSKKKTLFDALVIATGKRYGSTMIFSFDSWYKEFGFLLVSEVMFI